MFVKMSGNMFVLMSVKTFVKTSVNISMNMTVKLCTTIQAAIPLEPKSGFTSSRRVAPKELCRR